MAGFVTSTKWENAVFQFHIDTPDLTSEILEVANSKRVITFQLDGDELEAALWGFENYSCKKDN